MVLGPFAETKGPRLPGRNPVPIVNLTNSSESNEYHPIGPQFFVNQPNKSREFSYNSGLLERSEKPPCFRTTGQSDTTSGIPLSLPTTHRPQSSALRIP